MKPIKIYLTFTFISVLILTVCLFTTPYTTHAQTRGTLELTTIIGGSTNAVFVQGDIAYINQGVVLNIFNISDPTNPSIQGEIRFGGMISDVSVIGDMAYIVHSDGFAIVDVTEPTNPVLVGTYYIARAWHVQVVENTAYITNDALKTMTMIDVTNPENPSFIGSFSTNGNARGLQVSGNLVYVAEAQNSSMSIWNVDDPISSLQVSTFDFGSNTFVHGMQVVGNFAYVVNVRGLAIVDVLDPANPSLISTYYGSSPGGSSVYVNIQIVDNIAYIAGNAGLMIMDVADPENPSLLGSLDIGYTNDVQIVDNLAYLTNSSKGFSIVDISNPANPLLIYEKNSIDVGWTRSIDVVDGTAYIAGEGDDGFTIVDVNEPTNATLMGFFDSSLWNVQVVADTAYVSIGSTIKTIDVSDPNNPTLLGEFDNDQLSSTGYNGTTSNHVVDNTLYFADRDKGLLILDVNNPDSPFLIGSYSSSESVRGVQVVDDVAYVANENDGLTILNVSDSTNPTLLGSYDTEGTTNDVKIIGDVAYIADGSNGLVLLNVSNPASPTFLGSYATSAFKLLVEEDIIYIAGGIYGLIMIDVADPSNPYFLASFDTGHASDVKRFNDSIYVATGGSGIFVLEYVLPSDETEPQNDVCSVGSATVLTVDTAPHSDYLVDVNGEPDVDWYQITVPAGQHQLTIESENGDVIANIQGSCDQPDGGYVVPNIQNSYTLPEVDSPTTYYFQVERALSGDDSVVPYTIEVITVPTYEEADETNDRDGDGIPDEIEENGYYGIDGSHVDLPAMGADPDHKDIFVEIDYMVNPDSILHPSYRPPHESIQIVVDAFNNAGIHLHVDYGTDAPLTWGTAEQWGSLSRADELPYQEYMGECDGSRFNWYDFSLLEDEYQEEERMPIFHYNIWGHTLCSDHEMKYTLGLSRNAGGGHDPVSLAQFASGADDFLVLSPLAEDGFTWSDQELAGVFMHELGHNLGLMHGGADHILYKPNYMSVMNYLFTESGLNVNGEWGHYDYSRYENPSLDENNLDETLGLNYAQWPISQTKFLDPYDSDYEVSINQIDWNQDGVIGNQSVSLDLTPKHSNELIILHTQNDWEKLSYTGGVIGKFPINPASGFVIDPSRFLPETTLINELPINPQPINLPNSTLNLNMVAMQHAQVSSITKLLFVFLSFSGLIGSQLWLVASKHSAK